jgi:RNA polymerase sigma-70 factor (TIGR02954 family)
MTLEERVALAKSGDDQAFFELAQEMKGKLFSIAIAYLKEEADAIEAIQESTFRAYLKLHRLKEPRFFHTWFIRILIRVCIDEQKRRKKTFFLDRLPDTLAQDLELEEKLHLRMAVDHLPPPYRHIIILKYFEDMTLSEIARLLEKPEGTIKTWLHKALTRLRVHIRKEAGGEHA